MQIMRKKILLFAFIHFIFINFAQASNEELGTKLPSYTVIPFILMLLAISILPFIVPRFWGNNRNKFYISLILAFPVMIYYLMHSPFSLYGAISEYLSFIILLASLYIISGGILLTGDLTATPQINTLVLLAGSILASFIGTTGASMLLIRPILKINSERTNVKHTVIFFIFLVSNIGGCLTPLGDPPLYLGYLHGVPFSWTFKLFPNWLFMVGSVLLVYYLYENYLWKKEPAFAKEREKLIIRPLGFLGYINIFLLAGIIICTAFLPFSPYREVIMILLAYVSIKITPIACRKGNDFTYNPIIEVAVLFLGIFLTMIPALDILKARGAQFGITKAWHFFWAAGGLSSFLDNAPTYLTFLSLAQGLKLPSQIAGISEEILKAISLGAVFMGANSYIGNGPNFMVKSIAEERGVQMPSFFSYMIYSILILLPLFFLHMLIFL